ncbi:MAG: hypothetical protein AAFZ11_00770 [Pseudomonadota bacterium]
MRPSRNQQINRALSLLDRVIALIEADDQAAGEAIGREPVLSAQDAEQIKCRSPYWKDEEIRAAILSLYGRASTTEAAALLASEFGAERAPSRSILARLFAMIAREKQG